MKFRVTWIMFSHSNQCWQSRVVIVFVSLWRWLDCHWATVDSPCPPFLWLSAILTIRSGWWWQWQTVWAGGDIGKLALYIAGEEAKHHLESSAWKSTRTAKWSVSDRLAPLKSANTADYSPMSNLACCYSSSSWRWLWCTAHFIATAITHHHLVPLSQCLTSATIID